MAISYVGEVKVPSVDDSANQGTTVTFTPPSMTSGDFVLVYVATYLGSQSWSVTTTGGQTWTEVFDETRSGTHALYWCIWNGNWSANPVFTRTGASANDIMGWMVVLRGVHSTTPWDVDPASRTAADTNDQDFVTFNTNYDGSWAVWGGFEIDNNTCTTNNGGAWSSESTTDVGWRVSTLLCMAWCRKYIATAGAAGATTLNYAANDAGGKWSGALRAQPAANNVTHVAASATATGGTHTTAKTKVLSHTAAGATATGGNHTKVGTKSHTAASASLSGGVHTRASGKSHTAASLTANGGTHTLRLDRRASHTAASATLTGGGHSTKRDRSHTAASVSIQGGAQTKALRRSATAGVLTFTGGSHTASKGGGAAKEVSASAASATSAGGIHTLSEGRVHAAGALTLSGGSSSVLYGRVLEAGSLTARGNTHAVSGGPAVPDVEVTDVEGETGLLLDPVGSLAYANRERYTP